MARRIESFFYATGVWVRNESSDAYTCILKASIDADDDDSDANGGRWAGSMRVAMKHVPLRSPWINYCYQIGIDPVQLSKKTIEPSYVCMIAVHRIIKHFPSSIQIRRALVASGSPDKAVDYLLKSAAPGARRKEAHSVREFIGLVPTQPTTSRTYARQRLHRMLLPLEWTSPHFFALVPFYPLETLRTLSDEQLEHVCALVRDDKRARTLCFFDVAADECDDGGLVAFFEHAARALRWSSHDYERRMRALRIVMPPRRVTAARLEAKAALDGVDTDAEQLAVVAEYGRALRYGDESRKDGRDAVRRRKLQCRAWDACMRFRRRYYGATRFCIADIVEALDMPATPAPEFAELFDERVMVACQSPTHVTPAAVNKSEWQVLGALVAHIVDGRLDLVHTTGADCARAVFKQLIERHQRRARLVLVAAGAEHARAVRRVTDVRMLAAADFAAWAERVALDAQPQRRYTMLIDWAHALELTDWVRHLAPMLREHGSAFDRIVLVGDAQHARCTPFVALARVLGVHRVVHTACPTPIVDDETARQLVDAGVACSADVAAVRQWLHGAWRDPAAVARAPLPPEVLAAAAGTERLASLADIDAWLRGGNAAHRALVPTDGHYYVFCSTRKQRKLLLREAGCSDVRFARGDYVRHVDTGVVERIVRVRDWWERGDVADMDNGRHDHAYETSACADHARCCGDAQWARTARHRLESARVLCVADRLDLVETRPVVVVLVDAEHTSLADLCFAARYASHRCIFVCDCSQTFTTAAFASHRPPDVDLTYKLARVLEYAKDSDASPSTPSLPSSDMSD